MILIIAEKPSVAKAIASCLSGTRSGSHGDGFIAVGDTTVTWCFGHILELAPPEHYNPSYKKWNADHLPYAVSDFVLLPKPEAEAQLKVIGKLLHKASEVVNCGDPDREGQMLVDEVLEHFAWRGKTLRMHLNSTDDASVKKALKEFKDNRQFRPLFEAAKCRSQADWIVGMNMTVAATKLLATDLVSVGRVQTPTLALVVRRDLEIEGFAKREFFNIAARLSTPAGEIELAHEPGEEARIWDKTEADGIAGAISSAGTVDLAAQVSTKREAPPKPYSLLTFSKDAGKRFGWTAKQCLDILQKLYEPEYGLTTYPRTNSEFLKDEHRAAVPSIIETVLRGGHVAHGQHLAAGAVIRDGVFDSAKVIEHHAIIPTAKSPGSNLAGDLLLGYQLVAERFLMAVSADFEFEETILEFKHGERAFRLKGSVPLNTATSWRVFSPKAESPVPRIDSGQFHVVSCAPVRGETSPPKRYTEPDLMSDMAAVAKFVTDEKIKARLKETSGIGTAATRASILETLKRRGYVEAQGKCLVSTAFGRAFIAAMPDVLKDPGMTALWEDALDQVALGAYAPGEFMAKINGFVQNRVADMRAMRDVGVKIVGGKPKEPCSAPKTGAVPAKPKAKGGGKRGKK